MNSVIEFKKEVILSDYIREISDISITHDYKILEDVIEGKFNVVGEYIPKSNVTKKEDFIYNIPFSIAISSLIEKESIDLTINDFNYSFKNDTLKLEMSLMMNYIEKTLDYNKVEKPELLDNSIKEENIIEEEKKIEEIEEVKTNINNMSKDLVDNDYSCYKVYIYRQEDTLESIAIKYNVTMEQLQEYNDLSEIQVGSKIVIPSNE